MEIKKNCDGTISTKILNNKILKYDPSTDSYQILILPISIDKPPTAIGPITSDVLDELYNIAWQKDI
jgi:hypothetical protein